MHHCSFSQTWPGSRSSLSERPLPYQPTMTLVTLPRYTVYRASCDHLYDSPCHRLTGTCTGMHVKRHISMPPPHTHRHRLTGTCTDPTPELGSGVGLTHQLRWPRVHT